MKRHTLHPTHLELCIAVGDAGHPRLMRALRINDDDTWQTADARTYYQPDHPAKIGIWLQQGAADAIHTDTAHVVETVAHEAVHATDFLFTFIGEDQADELHAWHTGHIARLIWEQLQ